MLHLITNRFKSGFLLLGLILGSNTADFCWAEGDLWHDPNKNPSLQQGIDEVTPFLPPPQRQTGQPSPYEGPPGYNPDKPPNLPKAKQKPWWKFWEPTPPPPKPVPVERITEIGPRQFAAYPDPLLRLPVGILTQSGYVEAGVYILKANIQPQKPVMLELYRAGRLITSLPASLGTSSTPVPKPVTFAEPQLPISQAEQLITKSQTPPVSKLQTTLNTANEAVQLKKSVRVEGDGQGHLRILYQEGPLLYQTNWQKL